jgi:transposase
VLQRQHREQLSCRQVAALYDIRNSNQVAVWRQQYETGGLPALETKHRRHIGTMQKPKLPLCPAELNKNDANTLQALREENERLRAEVAYLKKLQALIQEKKLAAQ